MPKKKDKIVRTVWTMGYFPFQMGGNVHRPMSTEVKASELHDTPKGIKLFTFLTPKGTLRVCEAETGAIVGNSLGEVMNDIATAKKSVMKAQVREAKLALRNVKVMTPDEFFKLYDY